MSCDKYQTTVTSDPVGIVAGIFQYTCKSFSKSRVFIYPADDLISVMMGSEPVEKMVEDLLNSYNEKGLEEMITEVNQKAAELGY